MIFGGVRRQDRRARFPLGAGTIPTSWRPVERASSRGARNRSTTNVIQGDTRRTAATAAYRRRTPRPLSPIRRRPTRAARAPRRAERPARGWPRGPARGRRTRAGPEARAGVRRTLVSAAYWRRGRGVAATLLRRLSASRPRRHRDRGISTPRPRRRRDSSETYPRRERTAASASPNSAVFA